MRSRFFIALALGIEFVVFAGAAFAQAPRLLNYQGKLAVDGGAASGSYEMTFAIYAAATGGSPLWNESQTVTVTNRVFNVLLGSVTPFPSDLFRGTGDRFLGIKVGSDPEMTPRFRLTSVPYAIQAARADTAGVALTALSGTPPANSVNSASIVDGSVQTVDLADNAVTIDKIQPSVLSSLGGVSNDGGNIDLVAGANITITPDDSANTITIAASAGGDGHSLDAADGNPVDVVFVDNDGKVGVGTTTPDEKLSVTGMIGLSGNGFGAVGSPTIKLTNTTSTSGRAFGLNSANTGAFQIFDFTAGNLTRFLIDAEGNVGIGTATPQSPLHVRGTITTDWDLTMRQYESDWGDNASHIFLRRAWSSEFGDYMYFGVTGNRSNTAQAAMVLAEKRGISFGKGKDEGDGLAESHMVISNSGNVGIGTTSPSAALDVNGQIRLSGKLNRTSTGPANMVPIAYGNIASDGTINVGTGNFSSVWDSSYTWYRITINGENYFWKNYITIVTPMTGGTTATTSSVLGDLIVEILDAAGTRVQGAFQFVTYKP